MSKRGQIPAQIFLYVLTIVIVSIILVMGYNYITTTRNTLSNAELSLLQKRLTTDIKTTGDDYGTFRKTSYAFPGSAELCLFDLSEREKILESELINFYPLIKDSIESGINKNAFIVAKKQFESFDVGDITLNHYPHFKCFEEENGKINLGIEGRGDKALILSEFISSVSLDSSKEIELASIDDIIKLVIPAGTTILDQTVDAISIEIVDPGDVTSQDKISDIYKFEPSGTTFSQPIELLVEFNPNELGGCPDELVFTQHNDDGSLKAEIPSKEIDCENNIAIFEINGFSYGYIRAPRRYECLDTDKGKNYYQKGVIHYYDEKYRAQDSCSLDGNQLIEYYCEGDQHLSKVYECPNGCQDGACIVPCTPKICDDYPTDCGSLSDGCGGIIICDCACITIINNGASEEKVDLVFVPDDYMNDEELLSDDILSFKTRVAKFIDYTSIEGGLFSKEPFKSNKDLFNIFMLNIKENKDCQIPNENGGDQWDCKVWAEEKAKLCPGHDSVVVLSDDLSGTGGQSGYAYTGMNFAQITPFSISKEEALKYPELYLDPWISTFVHEFGHSFGSLKDEYYTHNVYDDPSQYPNCDSFGCPKWCSGTTNLPAPQYEECSKITNQQDCENANLNPPCIWTQLYGNYVCRGTFSEQNFGINCLNGYGCYQGCEGLNGYRSELGCNIMGGKCTGNEDRSSLEFSPRGKDFLRDRIIELSSTIETCNVQGGFICSSDQLCPGTSLTASDTDRCCDAACVTAAGNTCDTCGDGLFNVCDEIECYNLSEGCFFIDNLIVNQCNTCAGAVCESYGSEDQTCQDDPCNLENCGWDSVNKKCVTLPYCGDGNLDSGEKCDGNSFGSISTSCAEYSTKFISGELTCTNACTIDTSNCIPDQGVCFDSDNGINYFEKGILDWPIQNYRVEDSCFPDGVGLTEYYCTTDAYSRVVYECPNGCQDGACLPVQEEPFCGDGNLDTGEQCDDGTLNGQPNQCNSLCTGITQSVCGNSVLESGEQCDDRNTLSGDGCSSTCQIETCSAQSGFICSSNQLCPGTSLTASDTYRCCDVACINAAGNTCDTCGDGLFNLCDRNECNNILEGCFFINGLLVNQCNACAGAVCESYGSDQQTCQENICGLGNCGWDSVNKKCVTLPYCGDGNLDGGEQCDGNNFGSISTSCAEYSTEFIGGELTCTNACIINTSNCIPDEGVCFDSDLALVINIFDISNPSNIQRVGFSADIDQFPQEILVSGDYAYTIGGHLEIFDISNPNKPDRLSGIAVGNSAQSIALSGDYVYVVGRTLEVFDVSNHSNPVKVIGINLPNSGLSIDVSGEFAYISADGKLFIYNISNPSNPIKEGETDFPGAIYSKIIVSGNYAYVASHVRSPSDNDFEIFDISDSSNPVKVGSVDVSGYPWDIELSNNYAYIANIPIIGGVDKDALKIYDISDPSNPVEVGGTKLSSDNGYVVEVSGNNVYVTSGIMTGDKFRGFFEVYDISNPINPILKTKTPFYGRGLDISGNYAYLVGADCLPVQEEPFCGDGIVQSGESCDDGTLNGQPNQCNSLCTGTTQSVCGNSVLESGEQCDDNNTLSGDGCSSTCQTETCSEQNGFICGSDQLCLGTSLTSSDTNRCCDVACVTDTGNTCDTCGDGLFNVCDRNECNNILEGCFFINGLLVNQCNVCAGAVCESYGSEDQTCQDDKCGLGNCGWDSVNKKCVTLPYCGDGTSEGSCSSTKPLFCDSTLTLVNDCTTCGCPAGQECQADDTCISVFISLPQPVTLGNIPEDAAIIFWSTRDVKNAHILGPSNLYEMDKDGGNVKQITFKPDHYEHAAVSFDRKYIAATTYNYDSGVSIQSLWITDLIKNTEARLVPSFRTAGPGGIDWSPNSAFIYFAGKPKESSYQNIYQIRPDGTDLTQLTFLSDDTLGSQADLSVSEDGTLVAYIRAVPARMNSGELQSKTQVWVMNSDGSNQHMVDDGGSQIGIDTSGFPIGDYDPEISPDNKYVVFSRINTQNKNFNDTLNTAHDLWVAPLDGSAQAVRITDSGPIAIIPDWHDGKILYTSYDESGKYVGLVTINPDGTGKRKLETNLTNPWDGGRHGKWIPSVKPSEFRVKVYNDSGNPIPKEELMPEFFDFAVTSGVFPLDRDYNAVPLGIADVKDGIVTLSENVQDPLILHFFPEVPGFGQVKVYADNAGEGYSLASLPKEIDLPLEAAKSRIAKTEALMEKYPEDIFSRKTKSYLSSSKEHLNRAVADQNAGSVYGALRDALWAGELATIEVAEYNIAQRGYRNGFQFGVAISSRNLDDDWGTKENYVSGIFNFVTLPEFFIAGYERIKGEPNPEGAEKVLSWAESVGIEAKGHPLVYLVEPNIPSWLKDADFSTFSDAMQGRIERDVSNFRGRITAWDVLNEVNNPNPYTQDQILQLTKTALEATKKSDPEATRIINVNLPLGDHLASPNVGQMAKQDRLKTSLNYFNDLEKSNADYDVIGIQMYYWGLDMMEISRMLDRYAKFGKPIHISEIGISSAPGVDKKSEYFQDQALIESLGEWHAPWSEEIQADYTEQLYIVAYSKPYVEAITWWDLTDDFWPFGGLLNRNGTPKEAYWRLKDLLESWGFNKQ